MARVHHGGVWASLLAAGAAAPHGFGRRLLPLLETSTLLAHQATRHAAGLLIRALEPLLTEQEHATLEDRILAVEAFFDLNDPEQAERAAHARDQLLGCLTPKRVQTQQARARLAHLVGDRLDITGARWGLQGAEAVLKLRALHSNGDFDAYWQFHLTQEHQRVHQARYQDSVALAA